MRKKLRLAVMLLLGLVFVGSIGLLIHRNADYQAGEETYAEAEELARLPELTASAASDEEKTAEEDGTDPYAEALENMDFQALQKVNGDVLGWIVIPDTIISYPVLQGTDNDYYLNHTWKKEDNAVGAIFLDCQSSPDLSDFNTIIYGHRMNSKSVSMFATLKKYQEQSYWEEHPCFYLTTGSGSYKYEIFAAYQVPTSGTTYQIGFSGDEARQAFLSYCLERSEISTGITPAVSDRIVTLSTCSGNGRAVRWVVQGRLAA